MIARSMYAAASKLPGNRSACLCGGKFDNALRAMILARQLRPTRSRRACGGWPAEYLTVGGVERQSIIWRACIKPACAGQIRNLPACSAAPVPAPDRQIRRPACITRSCANPNLLPYPYVAAYHCNGYLLLSLADLRLLQPGPYQIADMRSRCAPARPDIGCIVVVDCACANLRLARLAACSAD